jgi:adenylate cyclase
VDDSPHRRGILRRVRLRWLRILDIGSNPGDDPDLLLRKRTAVAVLLSLCLAGVGYMFIGWLTNRPLVLLFAVLQMGGQLLNLTLYTRVRRLEPFVWTTIGLGLATVFSGVLTLGGLALSAGNVIWVIIAPLGAILLINGRAGIPVYAGVVVIVVGSALLDPFIAADQALPHGSAVAAMVVNVLGTAGIALGLVRYIDGQRLAARRESDALLRNVLPEPIANRLKSGERVIADHYEQASVLFADVVDFTPFAEAHSPQETVAVLNELFTDFDHLADRLGLEKIKTIGDAYMVVAGVPEAREDHAAVLVEMALAMHRLVTAHEPVYGRKLQIRTGIASGPVVAGVIGERKFSFDLWGDTVNTAARMESSGVPDQIQVTDQTCRLLAGRYPFERREGVEVKGKGRMSTWTLNPAAFPSIDAS